MSIKYLKQIKGTAAPVRVDTKPSFGLYTKTSATDNREVYQDGEWYTTSGGELVTNGTFDTDTTGWTAAPAHTLVVENKRLKLTRTSDTSASSYIAVTTVIGVEYSFSGYISSTNGSIKVGTTGNSGGATDYDMFSSSGVLVGTVSGTFVALATTTYINLYLWASSTDVNAYFDNITLFKTAPTLSATPLPPQSYIEDETGQLAEFEVIDGNVVDVHKAGYVPAIVENGGKFKDLNVSDTASIKTLAVTDGFDLGQTWQDVLASRSQNVTYTNATGKPIMVSVSSTRPSGELVTSFTINGVVVANAEISGTTGLDSPFALIVGDGDTYKFSSNYLVKSWSELR